MNTTDLRPTNITTLPDDRADQLATHLAATVAASPTNATGEVVHLTARRAPRRRMIAIAAAAVIAIGTVVGVVAFDAGRSSSPAEAMFTVTPQGDWINIAPNIDGATFDADAAVEQLRSLGFTAERDEFREWTTNGERNTAAPDHGGLGLGSHSFQFTDGTEVIISIEGPVGAEFPLSPDGTTLDWNAAADQFGFRNPLAAQWEGIELRRDAPVTIWISTAP